jgi:hypothetical protein
MGARGGVGGGFGPNGNIDAILWALLLTPFFLATLPNNSDDDGLRSSYHYYKLVNIFTVFF